MKTNLLQKFIMQDTIGDTLGAVVGTVLSATGIGAFVDPIWAFVSSILFFSKNRKSVGPIPAFVIAIENFLNVVLAIFFGFQAVMTLIWALFSFSWIKIIAAAGGAAAAFGSYYALGWILAIFPMSTIMHFFFDKAKAATKVQNKISEYVSAFVYLETADQEAGGAQVDANKITEDVKKRHHVKKIDDIAGDDYYKRWKKGKSIANGLHKELKKSVQERLAGTEDAALTADEQAIRISDTVAKQIEGAQADASLDPAALQKILDEYNALIAAVKQFEEEYQDLDNALQGNSQRFTSPETVVVQLLKLEEMVNSFVEMFNSELQNVVGQEAA